ncbi:hypothetical protein [Phyllobacterium lublinensis]|uniref:hypothetical protein n=1 Tax=Phyllobacterium lublinensis TaxID=2875708 RepID=UPI001CCFFC13|nr:hypothetical protein [Phyllobacterium sp. 2063]MBZ9653940.1 hypothetical protein [Phyllobacterium sp. 2063]
MSKLCQAAALTMLLADHVIPVHAQQSDPPPMPVAGCSYAMSRLAPAIDDYRRTKFALDRAVQLLASARYSSRVGRMDIDLAGPEAEADGAIAAYARSIGPAFGAIALVNASCRDGAAKLAGNRFGAKLDRDVATLLSGSADRLVDDQVKDIENVFSRMKVQQK